MRKGFLYRLPLLFLAIWSLTNCQSREDKQPLQLPTQYESASYEANTTTERTMLNQLAHLKSTINAVNSTQGQLSASSLRNLYTGSLLQSAATAYYNSLVLAWLNDIARASEGGTYDIPNEGRAANGKGGFFGGRLFDANGLELVELIEKGLFEAAFYHHAYRITQKTDITLADIDRLVAIFGAHPDFANSDNASKHANPDRAAARYAAKRDKNDGNGFYTRIKQALLRAQAAIRAGSAYEPELRAALQDYLQSWERSCAATVVNYLYRAIDLFSMTNPSATDLANALHNQAEPVGFIHGWRRLPQEARIITDEQIDNLLDLLLAPAEGEARAYLFVTDRQNQIGRFAQAIQLIQQIYNFSNSDLEDFRRDWVQVQNR